MTEQHDGWGMWGLGDLFKFGSFIASLDAIRNDSVWREKLTM